MGSDYHRDQQWLDMLYYESKGSGYKSLADDDSFFVSPEGKTNPQAEFEASLRRVEAQDESFRRTFPLRYKYIAHLKNIPYQPLIQVNDRVERVVLGFPSRYLASPTSMFGHLFLILKTGQKVPYE